MWAQSAQQGFSEAATAAAAGDGMKAMMAAGNATANCKQCHGMYREGNPQEGFKFKAGTLP
jgi:cytochrome c553